MPFNVTQRQVIVFTVGIALGVGAAWAVFSRHSSGTGQVAAAPSPASSAKPGHTPVAVAVGACAFTPVVTTAAGDDGRVQLQTDVAGASAKDVDAWILDGKEAVAAGRQKDAEADFLMACRAAEKLGDSGAMPQAEAMYNLGRHYASLAGAVAESRSGELWRRSGSLFAASLQAYSARYGESSDKTRFAAKGLAEAKEHTGGAPVVAAGTPAKPAPVKVAKTAPPAPEPAKVQPPKEVAQAPVPAPAPAPAVVAKAKEPVAKPAVVVAPPVAPRVAEPAVAVARPRPAEPVAKPKPAEPAVAVAKPKPPEAAVAVAKPRPRTRPAVQADEEATVMEPPARAVGNAVGSATGDAHDGGAYAQ